MIFIDKKYIKFIYNKSMIEILWVIYKGLRSFAIKWYSIWYKGNFINIVIIYFQYGDQGLFRLSQCYYKTTKR